MELFELVWFKFKIGDNDFCIFLAEYNSLALIGWILLRRPLVVSWLDVAKL